MVQTDKPAALKPRTKNGRNKRRWIPYTGALVLAALIVLGLWPKPALVETAQATLGPLRVTVNEEGKTRLKQRYLLAAPISGQLRRIPFKAGAEVERNQTVLAIMDPLPPVLLDERTRTLAEARLASASANLEKARAAHDFAASELRRVERLFAEKTVSEQDFEGAQWRETAAAKEKLGAESALREAEAELIDFNRAGRTNSLRAPVELMAPVKGRVLRVFEESARTVPAGTPLLEVGDPADLEVVVEVLSRDGAVITPGQRVELDQWGGAAPLEARVRLVEPSAFLKISALGVEEQRVNVIADLVTPPDQRPTLGDAFRVEAHIIIWETNQTLKIPSGALFRRGQQWAAFVVTNGRAQLRVVQVGRSNGREGEVLSGLKANDEVIVYPGDRVRDGIRVKSIKI